MIISSTDKSSRLIIERADESDVYAGYFCQIEVHDREGVFRAQNTGVHFEALESGAVDEFFANRDSSLKLSATEDCCVELFRWNAKGDIGIRYQIGKYRYEGEPMHSAAVHLLGSFQVDSEQLMQLEQLVKIISGGA